MRLVSFISMLLLGGLAASCSRQRSGMASSGATTATQDGSALPSELGGTVEKENEGLSCTPSLVNFARDVWVPIVKQDCGGCHIAGGFAAQAGSKFVFESERNPDYLAVNRALLETFAELVLKKTSGEVDHAGGVRFTSSSSEYEVLDDFLNKFERRPSCELSVDPALFEAEGGLLTLTTPKQLLRKAALQVAGRLPSSQENKQVAEQGMEGVEAVLDKMMQEPGFLEWIRQTYNEEFLTDKFLGYVGAAINGYRFKNFRYFEREFAEKTPEQREAEIGVHFGAGREALELIKYVVRLNKPFHEILTADYMMVNPYSARAFLGDNHGVSFKNQNDAFEYVPVKVPLMYGHSGLLTSHSLLYRYSTTDSNRNRLRARMIYKFFLDTDIMQISARSAINLTTLPDPQTPVLTNPACVSCHSLIDPVASAYQHYKDTALWDERYVPWYTTMLPAGFEGKQLPSGQIAQAVPWLGQQLAKDPRFVAATVRRVFTSLMGRAPLQEPLASDVNFEPALRSYLIQRQILAAVGQAFVKDNYNFKTIVKELIKTPYYRAESIADGAPADAELLLEGFGNGRRRPPEELDRILSALTGQRWIENRRPVLASQPNTYLYGKPVSPGVDYNLLLGGYDSDAVTETAKGGNSIQTRAELDMARKVACKGVVHDFALAPQERTLLPLVEADTTPETPANVAKIKENIRHLHAMMLGEEPSEQELDASLQLFEKAWRLGVEPIKKGVRDASRMPYYCHLTTYDEYGRGPAGSKGLPGADLPAPLPVGQDPLYVRRAWMTVVATLLADYRFLYD